MTSANDQKITFRTPLGQAVAAQIGEVKLAKTTLGVETFFISLTVDYPLYRQIDEQELFNLLPQVRNQLALEKLEAEIPVEIEAILKPALAKFLQQQNLTAAEVAKLLLQADQPYDFLRDTESWLAYTVWQHVALPDDMQDYGSLKLGYKTLWQAAPADLPPAPMREVVQMFFLQKHWPYEDAGDDLYRLHVDGDQMEWVCLVKLDEARHFCLVYSILPELTPEARRADMAAFLAQTNYDLGIGSFEMDMADGEIRFRTSLDVEGDRLSLALFEQLLTTNISTMEQYLPALLERMAAV